MINIKEKIYKFDEKKALIEIFDKYFVNWYLVVNYLYFANLVSNWIIWNQKLNQNFLNAVVNGDFLLPDWIALKLYFKKYFSIELSNLNWTDFSDYLLSNLEKGSFNFYMYWARKDVISVAADNISKKYWLKVDYFQDWFSDFDFEKLSWIKKSKINILMVWLWTPKQEIWAQDNLENIKKYNLLVLTQWWTFDFWAWNEKRAPKIFITLKMEWFWRFITNPKKNFKKVVYSFYLFYFLLKK